MARVEMTLDQIRAVHPDWLARRSEWEDLAAALSRQIDKRKYLPKGPAEAEPDYATRVQMTEWIPESPVALGRIIGALFAHPPRRQNLPPDLERWRQRVTRGRLQLDHWQEQVNVPIMLGYGASHVLIDRPPAGPDGPPQDLDEQRRRGLLDPYLAVYTPLEVRNWQIGVDGLLDWVVLLEQSSVLVHGKREPRRTYRLLDREGWTAITTRPTRSGAWAPPKLDPYGNVASEYAASEEPVERADGTHPPGLNRVPLVSFIHDEQADLIGRSVIREAVRLDLERLRLISDQMYDLYSHAHPTLAVNTNREMAEVAIGSNTYIKLKASKDEPEDARYVAMPESSFSARQERIREVERGIQRHTGADPLGVIEGAPAGASGVARAWSFATSEERHLARIADRLEQGERELLSTVARFLGIQDEIPADAVKWPDSFSLDAPAELVEETMQFAAAVRSDTAVREKEKRLVRTVLGDLDPRTQAAIETEIDTQPRRAPVSEFAAPAEFAS